MKKKKIVLFVFLIVGILSLILTYKLKQNSLSKNKPVKEEKLSIMIKEQGATDYTKSSSKDIPKGNYTLNTEKTHCENNGQITGYDSTTGTVSFVFIGSDKCYLYFDYYIEPGYLTILNTNGGKTAIEAKGTPDFASTATENEGMYSTEDDFGTSYYFRGAVDNNWVKFGEVDGEPIYWRIIRVNGDGSIRLLYTGTTAPTESQKTVMTGTGTQISTSAFNSSEDINCVGYKYGGGQHGLTNNSTIKLVIENWYKTTSLSTDILVTDNYFCYDRTVELDDGTYGEISDWGSGGGYLSYYFGSYGRIHGNKTGPSLKCVNESDKYSVANEALSYPVGLITADEINMAGADNNYTSNSSYYLYTGQEYWLGSPSDSNISFSGGWPTSQSGNIYKINTNGSLQYANCTYEYSGVRPVISISKNVKLSGDGTWNNPYVVN